MKDFFTEKRFYNKHLNFKTEWDMRLSSNSTKDAVNLLRKMADIFEKSDEIDFADKDGHFMLKKIK